MGRRYINFGLPRFVNRGDMLRRERKTAWGLVTDSAVENSVMLKVRDASNPDPEIRTISHIHM